MNEVFFLIQILLVSTITIACWKWGKEALITNTAFQALFANLFLLKQIKLFGFQVTASDAFAVGSMLSLNFLQEFYGKKAASTGIRMSFALLLFYLLFSQIHLLYTPTIQDTAHSAYSQLFSFAPRLFFSSILSFWITQQFDFRFFGWLRRLLPKHTFSVRSTLSLIVSQGLDTLLFTFLGLYGVVASVCDVFFISFLVKCLTVCLFFPLGKFIKKSYEQTS